MALTTFPGSIQANNLESSDTFMLVATDATDSTLLDATVTRLKALKPLSDHTAFQTEIVSSNSDMNDLIDEDGADLTISDARVVVRTIMQSPGAKLLKVDTGTPPRAAVIFAVPRNSVIQSLDDLKGRTLAFEGVWNRSGYFAPMMHLLREDHDMHYLSSVRDKPEADAINFVFAGDEVNMVAWLDRGLVDAIAFNRTDWDNDAETPPHIRKTLRLILDDDLVMDEYLMLTRAHGDAQTDQIVRALTARVGGGLPLRELTVDEEDDLDTLIGTFVRTKGNYLAHE